MIRTDQAAPLLFDGPRPPASDADSPTEDLDRPAGPLSPGSLDDPEDAPTSESLARAGRRNLHEKLMAGLAGIKHAVRGDSSFFAHAYRASLVFLTAGMIGVPPIGWCLLIFALGMVLIAELGHSAIDTLARAIGDPDEPRLKMARDIAAAAVLVAVFASAAISITVLTLKLGDYLGWWDRSLWDLR